MIFVVNVVLYTVMDLSAFLGIGVYVCFSPNSPLYSMVFKSTEPRPMDSSSCHLTYIAISYYFDVANRGDD